jgi:hypothetical protein
MDEASKAMDLYQELFEHARPILEEHTYHSLRVKK